MKKLVSTIVNIVVLCWSVGYFYFKTSTEKYTLDNTTTTDVVVVFAGTKQKLYTGAQLVQYGYAPMLFVTSNRPYSYYSSFLTNSSLEKSQFIFDNEYATDLKDYGNETSKFVQKYRFDSIRLVASADEMPRALVDLHSKLPQYFIIVPHQVSKKTNNYWGVFIEYNKFLLIYLASLIGKANELNLSYS